MNTSPSLGDLWTYFGPTFGAGWGSKPIMLKTPEDFGGDPSGVRDSTKALNDWIASATAANPALGMNAGTYKFTSALNLPTNLNNFCIRGAGPTQSVFKYAGVSTTIDLMTGGNFVTNTSGWQLSGFRIASSTTMTAGAALHLKRLSQSLVDNVFMDATDQTSNQLLWNGFWFDGIHQVGLSNFMVYCGHNGIQLNGFDGASGNDFWLSQGSLTFCSNYGLLIGGNIGIVWCDGVEFIGNGTISGGAQVRVDNSLNSFGSVGNAGAIFSDTCHFDGLRTNGLYCLDINDTLISGGNLVLNCTIGSAVLDNMNVTSWPNSTIFMNGRNFNALRDGIRLSDATTILAIGAAASVDTNGGYGVNATVPTTKISSWGRTFSNTTADYSANTGLVNPYAAAAAYTPVVTAGSGTITAYTATGFTLPVANTKLQHVSGTIVITTNGTGATSLNVTLPTTAKRTTSGPVGRETVTSGAGLIGVLTATSNVMAIVTVGNAYPAVNGSNIQFNFTYERE
jgi:hypothetical protein